MRDLTHQLAEVIDRKLSALKAKGDLIAFDISLDNKRDIINIKIHPSDQPIQVKINFPS